MIFGYIIADLQLSHCAFFKFYLGKVKTIAQETAFHIALRNCSREVRYRSVYM